jgi:putative nucleotidyltransferase with HDIG domain
VNGDETTLLSDQQRLQRLLEQQSLVHRFTLVLGETTNLLDLYETICRYISELMDANAFIVSSYDPARKEIRARFIMADAVVHDASSFPPIPLEEEGFGVQSEVIRTGKPLLIPDFVAAMRRTKTVHSFSEDEGLPEPGTRAETESRISTRSALLVPMKIRGETVGVIQVQSKRFAAYSPEDSELLSSLANVAAIAIQNAQLLREARETAQRLRTTLDGAVAAIARTTEFRDPYTAGHQRRVADLTCSIAEELALDLDRIEGLRIAALLHDIGKMAIPTEMLTRPRELSILEYSMVKQHPQVAHDILKTINAPWPLHEIVLQHHERLDGSGYPQSLRADAIVLEARILAVADVVEAMCSHRPYRAAHSLDAALAEIEAHRGSLFDAAVVDACSALFRSGRFAFE